MDFIANLPSLKSFDSIFVVMDRFTKITHLVPCKKPLSVEDMARLFFDNVYQYHSLPDNIVFDRRIQFVSNFWRFFFEILRVDINSFQLSILKLMVKQDGSIKFLSIIYDAVSTISKTIG